MPGPWNASKVGTGSSSGLPSLDQIWQETQKREADSIAANKERLARIEGMYAGMSDLFKTGGFGDPKDPNREVGGTSWESMVRSLWKGMKTSVGEGTQNLISSGMYGTTTAAALPVNAMNQAQDVAMSQKGQFDVNQAGITQQLAGVLERVNEPAPDYGMLYQAMMAGNSQPTQQPNLNMQVYGSRGTKFDSSRMQPGSTAKEQARYSY